MRSDIATARERGRFVDESLRIARSLGRLHLYLLVLSEVPLLWALAAN